MCDNCAFLSEKGRKKEKALFPFPPFYFKELVLTQREEEKFSGPLKKGFLEKEEKGENLGDKKNKERIGPRFKPRDKRSFQ